MLPSFLAPALLFGTLAVAVPLALHFFYKPRYRKLPWAAMSFLRLSLEQTSRWLKFQEYVLLALRCLALLLLAFALARPTWNALGGGRGESIDAVFVFDTSYSMGAGDGEVTRLERAKAAALVVLDNLPPNSTVQIFTCADRANFEGPLSPGNLDQARQVVAGVALTSLAGDLLPGFAEADAALDRGAGSNKEVYVFTDLQKSGFDAQSAAIRAKAAELKSRSTLIFVRCANPAKTLTNVAITDLTYPGGIPHTRSRLPVTVMLKNTGTTVARQLTVTLEVEGAGPDKEAVTVEEIAAGQSLPVTLTAKLDKAGNQLLTARVQVDDVPGNNRLDRVLGVRESVRVLVVDGTPDLRDPKLSGSHYVQNALVPVPVDLQADYHVQVTVVTAEEAAAGLLGVNDICYLCNVPAGALPAEFRARLPAFVRQGGGLVFGLGEQAVPAAYNTTFGSGPGGSGLLPAELASWQTTTPEAPFKFAPDSIDPAGWLGRFGEEPFRSASADADLIGAVTFAEPGAGGAVLMRLTNQQPVLLSKVVGDGEVIVVGTPLDASAGNWPARAGSYLSFTQITLAHLAGRASQGFNATAGQALVWKPGEVSRPVEWVRPDQSRVRVEAAGGAAGSLTVTTPPATLAGVHRFAFEGDDRGGTPFAVAPDLRETADLATLSDGEVEDLLGFRPVIARTGPDATPELAAERSRREWTVWALLALLFVGVGESFWAWYCGRAV